MTIRFEDCMLRLMSQEDQATVFYWRNADHVRKNMYTDHLISPDEHAQWFARAINDPGACHLIFELQKRPVGVVSFTAINPAHERCTWAFYLGETDVPRGTGSAMEFLALTHAFETMHIRKLCCEVFAFNSSVIRLHEKFGFQIEGRFVRHYLKAKQYEDIVCMARFSASWQEEKPALSVRCFSGRGH